MQELPPEIQLKIYSLACRDDGTTGASLSAVSNFVRQISAEYRYQSIAVSGSIQIQRLVDTLRSLPAQLRRIRFLFIHGYPVLLEQRDRVTRRLLPRAGLATRTSPGDARPDAGFEWRHRMAQDLGVNMMQLVLFATPTVEILSVLCFDRLDLHASLQGHFPALVDLSLRGVVGLLSGLVFAPALRRLDIHAAAVPLDFASIVARDHPLLTCVRISDFRNIDSDDTLVDILVFFTQCHRDATEFPSPRRLLAGADDSGSATLIILEPYVAVLLALSNLRLRSDVFQLAPAQPPAGRTTEAKRVLEEWTMRASAVSLDFAYIVAQDHSLLIALPAKPPPFPRFCLRLPFSLVRAPTWHLLPRVFLRQMSTSHSFRATLLRRVLPRTVLQTHGFRAPALSRAF
ncbi:hypothetical protein DFH09DRAFT_1363610 [Mycena vulgaris]|nr:hypothetical protein DFH09DRAFT_1363610 [Mycena vulgaris]